MADAKKSPVGEIFENPKSGRIDFLNARTLAYSVAGELENVKKLAAEAQETHKASRAPEARLRSALTAGVGLWILRQYKEAIEALEPISDHADGAYFLGLCRMEMKDCAGAIRAFQKAARAGQDEFVCAVAEVEALRLADNREEALARIRALSKTHDNEAELHYQRGRLLEDAFECEAAMEAFERAVELNSQHVSALFRLAYWNDLRGNDDLALDYYEKAAAVPPARANLLINLGLLYEDRGEYEKAARAYARVLASEPTEPRARMYSKDAAASLDMFYDEATERRQRRTDALLRIPLAEFELSARAKACLEKMNVRTLGDLARLNEDDIVGSKNFGDTSLEELKELLESKGLRFGMGKPEASPAKGELLAPDPVSALARPVSGLDLSVRSLKCMRTLGIESVGDLVQKTEKDLLECQNFGQTSLNEIKQKLTALGVALKPRE